LPSNDGGRHIAAAAEACGQRNLRCDGLRGDAHFCARSEQRHERLNSHPFPYLL
jgi:hypothetical protein